MQDATKQYSHHSPCMVLCRRFKLWDVDLSYPVVRRGYLHVMSSPTAQNQVIYGSLSQWPMHMAGWPHNGNLGEPMD